MDEPRLSTGEGTTALGTRPSGARPPDDLLRDAWAIRKLLDDLDPEDHGIRLRLLLARDELRIEAARQWRVRGWRPITDRF